MVARSELARQIFGAELEADVIAALGDVHCTPEREQDEGQRQNHESDGTEQVPERVDVDHAPLLPRLAPKRAARRTDPPSRNRDDAERREHPPHAAETAHRRAIPPHARDRTAAIVRVRYAHLHAHGPGRAAQTTLHASLRPERCVGRGQAHRRPVAAQRQAPRQQDAAQPTPACSDPIHRGSPSFVVTWRNTHSS